MLMSSRASPPKPLKINTSEPYLSLKSLLPKTPIPSPSLPSILPRHGKKPPKLNSKRIVRAIIWLTIIISVYYVVAFGKKKTRNLADLTFLSSLGKTYEIVEAAELPNHPTPLALTDTKGRHHWTIWIPPKLGFPLASTHYADICSQVEEVARHVAGRPLDEIHSDYYYQDDANFIDVEEAQSRHFLPEQVDSSANKHLPICPRTLTYVLDATDAGLGSALLGMWVSYSLAKREQRTFFIDDTHFPYGNYSNFFTPYPKPTSCRPPPSSQRVPCPQRAKHLVVSAGTTPWTFGESFHMHFSQREIFDMAREGYEALFSLRGDDYAHVSGRAKKLRHEDNGRNNGLVGIHIRRGDRHPFEYSFQHGYLPPERYMDVARRLIGASEQWKVILASDDANMYDHIELPGAVRAQTRISLASKKQLEDASLGWEGGFFKDVFWGLGLPVHVLNQKKAGSPMPTMAKPPSPDEDGKSGKAQAKDKQRSMANKEERDYKTHPTDDALKLRELLGRAYLMDLAVLARSDKIICGVASNACRVLAVMLGWDRAFENKDWVNVDGNYGWTFLDY